jgi:hypothetical protein
MRSLAAAVLVVALVAAPAAAHRPADTAGLGAGSAISAMYLNLLYTPAKVVVATVGAIGGALAGVLTGGDERAAYALWVPTIGGEYFLRPGVLEGTEDFAFFGSDYDDTPSTADAENDATYAYEALYN